MVVCCIDFKAKKKKSFLVTQKSKIENIAKNYKKKKQCDSSNTAFDCQMSCAIQLDPTEDCMSGGDPPWFLRAVIGRILRGGPAQRGAMVMGPPSPWQPDWG